MSGLYTKTAFLLADSEHRTMSYFQYRDAQLHYIDVDPVVAHDETLPLVFVHGAGSSHLCWALQLREFSSTNRVIALDLSGHGMSDDIPGEASIDLGYALEVQALVQHLGLTDFILVGHSMGGGVVMSYCLNDSRILPRAIVLVDTSPDLELSKLAIGFVREAIQERIYLFKGQFYEDYTDSYKLKELEDKALRANPGVLQRDLLACNKFNIEDRVKEIQVPAFVVVGEHDEIITPSIAEALTNELPRADIAIIREAHHTPMIDQPEEFNRLLRKFIIWIEETD
jgi:3-oxoadipate enol-lactonase